MSASSDLIVLCSCEDSFDPAAATVASACPGARLVEGRRFCREEGGRLAAALSGAAGVTIACRQEQPALEEILAEAAPDAQARFVDIRGLAGWSSEADRAGPKIAALLAAAAEPDPPVRFHTMESDGVLLVYGRDATAIEVGQRLEEDLDVTVMLTGNEEVPPPRIAGVPVVRGTVSRATGVLGGFELAIDGFAQAHPSSRAALRFGPARDGVKSRAALIIDLSGGRPLFTGDGLRAGYLRADPRDPLAVERLVTQARGMAGTFDKPVYIDFRADLCAHSRSRITGCTRCLDVCPAGAIAPAGESVAIDPGICAGCGSCASVCPTGAASYALPPADHLMRRIRTLLRAYHGAGGTDAHVLAYAGEHGDALIDALARFGDGLPARVLPLRLNEVTALGPEALAALFAYGAAAVSVLTPVRPKHPLEALERTAAFAGTLLEALGLGADRLALVGTDDPDALAAALTRPVAAAPGPAAPFLPQGDKRAVLVLALREWHRVAPQQPARIPLPAGAPFGRIVVDVPGCTLCLACVSACPAGALQSNPDLPQLKFQEDLCVQCGLCQATCPERVISLEPRLDFTALGAPAVVVKEEEPYACDHCGKLFGTRSTIERIRARLGGSHWMYSGANAGRLSLIGLCDDCRVTEVTTRGFDPYGGPERPPVRTSEDYIREREAAASPVVPPGGKLDS